MLYYELSDIFQLFEISAPIHDFNLYRNDYQKFIDDLSGRNITAYKKTNAGGTPLEFEKDSEGNDTTVPIKVSGGDYEFADKVLNEILNRPIPEVQSWASFQEYVKKIKNMGGDNEKKKE
jgi:hypothetical protein